MIGGLSANEVAAQSSAHVSIVPQAGIMLSADTLGAAYRADGGSVVFGPRGPALAVGVSLEVASSKHPVIGRVTFLRTGAAEISLRNTCDPTPGMLCRYETYGGTASIGTAVADAVLELPWALGRFTPRLVGGLGVKRTVIEFRGSGREASSDLSVHLGAGGEARFGPVAAVLEIGDLLSWSGRRDLPGERARPGSGATLPENGGGFVHDVFITVGARVRVF